MTAAQAQLEDVANRVAAGASSSRRSAALGRQRVRQQDGVVHAALSCALASPRRFLPEVTVGGWLLVPVLWAVRDPKALLTDRDTESDRGRSRVAPTLG